MKHAPGSVPTLDDLKDYLKESLCEKENSWREMAEASAERVLMERLGNLKESSMEPIVDGSLGKKVDNSAFVTSKRDTVGGGNEAVLNALAGYLRYLEGTSRDDWQEYVAILNSDVIVLPRCISYESGMLLVYLRTC